MASNIILPKFYSFGFLLLFFLYLIFISLSQQQILLVNKIPKNSKNNNFDTSSIFQLGKELKYQTEWKRKMEMLLRRNYLIKSARKMRIINKEHTTGKSNESLKTAIKQILMGIYY
ncbi:hypothetical protein ACQ4LE_001806 [Meloidogyne hapla]